MGVTVRNVEIVQCMIFRWNPWTANWTRKQSEPAHLRQGNVVR